MCAFFFPVMKPLMQKVTLFNAIPLKKKLNATCYLCITKFISLVFQRLKILVYLLVYGKGVILIKQNMANVHFKCMHLCLSHCVLHSARWGGTFPLQALKRLDGCPNS